MTPSEEDVTVERLVLKPGWLERSGPRKGGIFGKYIVFIMVSAGLSIFLLFTAGNLQRFIGITLLVWISFSIIYAAGKNTKRISTWRRTSRYDGVENLPLKRDSETMERALNGLELSQTIVEKRLRKTLIEKIKDEKDLSMKEMNELLKQPSKLEKIVDNERLNDYLLNSKRMKDVIRSENSNDLSEEEGKDRSFKKRIEEVIEKISSWEGR